jgi:L-asparaginase
MGMSVEEAVYEALSDMRALDGGLLGRVTIHAIDKNGCHKVVAVNGGPENHYWIWHAGAAEPMPCAAEVLTITDATAPRPSASLRYAKLKL